MCFSWSCAGRTKPPVRHSTSISWCVSAGAVLDARSHQSITPRLSPGVFQLELCWAHEDTSPSLHVYLLQEVYLLLRGGALCGASTVKGPVTSQQLQDVALTLGIYYARCTMRRSKFEKCSVHITGCEHPVVSNTWIIFYSNTYYVDYLITSGQTTPTGI